MTCNRFIAQPDDGCGGVVSASWGGADSIYVADGSREAFHWSIGKESLNRLV